MEPIRSEKPGRKLSLDKETLRRLEPSQLKEAAGGIVSNQQTCRVSAVFTCLPLICV